MVLTTSMMVSTKAFGSNCWPWCSWWWNLNLAIRRSMFLSYPPSLQRIQHSLAIFDLEGDLFIKLIWFRMIIEVSNFNLNYSYTSRLSAWPLVRRSSSKGKAISSSSLLKDLEASLGCMPSLWSSSQVTSCGQLNIFLGKAQLWFDDKIPSQSLGRFAACRLRWAAPVLANTTNKNQIWQTTNQQNKYGNHNKPTNQMWQTQYLEWVQHLKLVVDEWDPVLRHLFCKFKSICSRNLFLNAFNSHKTKTWPVRPLRPCGLLAQKQNQYCSGCSRGDERTPSWIKIWFDRNVPSNIFLKSYFPYIKLILLSSRRFHFHDGLWPESPSGANCDDDDCGMIKLKTRRPRGGGHKECSTRRSWGSVCNRVDEAEGEVQEVQVPGSDQPCDCEVGKIIKPTKKKKKQYPHRLLGRRPRVEWSSSSLM